MDINNLTPQETLERLLGPKATTLPDIYIILVAMKEFSKQERKKAFNEARELDSSKAYKYVDYAHYANKNPLN